MIDDRLDWPVAVTVCVLLLLLWLTGCSRLDSVDRAMLTAAVAGQAMDYHSTVTGLDSGCVELNPIAGDSPDRETLLAMKLAATGVIVGGAYVINDRTWRRIWLGVAAAIGIGAGIHNYNVDCGR